ncbi:hypothetical protein McanCB56680_005460 [Microsporum canis]
MRHNLHYLLLQNQHPRALNAVRSPEPVIGAVYIASSVIQTPRATAARAGAGSAVERARAKEIERLRQRVKELEEDLKQHGNCSGSSSNTLTPASAVSTNNAGILDQLADHGGNKKYWQGIHTRTAQAPQTQCYGPASSFYFIGRMSSYLAAALQQPQSDDHMQPNSASKAFASPTSPGKEGGNGTLNLEGGQQQLAAETPTGGDYLTARQEDYFLNLFWQSYHCSLQIIDEAEFRQHYKSLWATPGASRKASALVDIVLAICMQYGIAFIPRSGVDPALRTDVNSNDATIAGRSFYRRCQSLLTSELESPSITTLQCHIFSVIYLCNASFQNMAHSTLAFAVRTAHILGLHLEPPDDLPQTQRELRKRLWWSLYTLESKTCMKLGRPWSVQMSEITCSLPADDHKLALLSGFNFASFADNITWLTYNVQNTKLVLTARAIYIAFYDKCADILSVNGGKSLYSEPQSLETCAEFLLASMKSLQTWVDNVPDTLKTRRKGSGNPFSTDRSPLDVELFAPLWLQRQRLLLELLYHNLAMNSYRPFICFSQTMDSCTPVADANAVSCVNHAIALTHIMHQMLTETDILNGWHESFQWQWNATLSMIGFILAYPISPSTPSARKAINHASVVFETFGNHFAVAANAANVTRDLTTKADFLIDRLRSPPGSVTFLSTGNLGTITQPFGAHNFDNADANNLGTAGSQFDDEASLVQTALDGAIGVPFTVNSFNGFEPLSGSNLPNSNTWTFTQD